MKYLVLLAMLSVGSPAVANISAAKPAVTPYEITDEDCDALNELTRGIAMKRDEGDSITLIKNDITSSPYNTRAAYTALTPKMLSIVDDVYSREKKSKSPEAEAEHVYMKCMDHIYAGTDF